MADVQVPVGVRGSVVKDIVRRVWSAALGKALEDTVIAPEGLDLGLTDGCVGAKAKRRLGEEDSGGILAGGLLVAALLAALLLLLLARVRRAADGPGSGGRPGKGPRRGMDDTAWDGDDGYGGRGSGWGGQVCS